MYGSVSMSQFVSDMRHFGASAPLVMLLAAVGVASAGNARRMVSSSKQAVCESCLAACSLSISDTQKQRRDLAAFEFDQMQQLLKSAEFTSVLPPTRIICCA